jgi:hypothetical protein
MKKTIFALIFLNCLTAYGDMIPTGYYSWRSSDDPSRRVMEFGSEPRNYWDGRQWTGIDSRFESGINGFRSIKSRHYVFVDTIADIVRFSMTDYNGREQILKSRIGPLFLFNRSTLDTACLALPDLSGYREVDDTIIIPEVYPGVSCYIINRPGGLEHHFTFSPHADTLINLAWRNAGSNPDLVTINSFELNIDSLNLSAEDNLGQFGLMGSHNINGDVALRTQAGYCIFNLKQGYLYQDTLSAPLYRRISRDGMRLSLYEGFRNSDIVSWPRLGYSHNDSRSWSTSTTDTYISAPNQGTSYYSSQTINVYRDATLGVRQRGLLWFRNLLDSLSGAVSIDSAILQLHYNSGAIGSGTVRLCRGIADSSWYTLLQGTWNARYRILIDSLPWAGGWGIHTSSFTTVNSVPVNLADTNSQGYYRFSCKNLISDIKVDGTDWGFWLDNGSQASSQRAFFDSAEDPNKRYPKLYLQYTTSAGIARRRRMGEL